ncbi:methionine ABC transporter permease [Oceanivirga miroungae]|uniref:Binding-protein-dependent transport system inner membrane protein n=1 Tax=Oceanivirga miroungae TaxID=1130046 RepID=A0A6I8MEV7_9FUSO|nr:methionine ABC transporter permease [Oceanivirga miroungae]VWL85779.1 binding-protein-dependent transport system inner membrane protein [Oceanivirga miroungae]
MLKSIIETIYMLFLSMLIASLIGIPLGISMSVSKKGGIKENLVYHKIVDILIINITRSIPFIILIVLLIPLSRFLVGKSYGTTAFIIPLAIATAPFISRIIESSLNEVDKGLIEMGISIGAKPKDIILKILIPEAMPSIINGLTLTLISLVSYIAMAGVVGGGGLGNEAIIKGYQRGNKEIMYVATIYIVVIVQIIQYFGTKIVKKIEKKRGK